jgi:hypothetical protein
MNSTIAPPVRFLGRCRACKRALRRDVAQTFLGSKLVTCPCGKAVRLQRVFGAYQPDVTCGTKCTSAVGPTCDCSCGGANHGGDH